MRIGDLPPTSDSVVIVGTGPSMRFMDMEALWEQCRGHTVILLNQAWKYIRDAPNSGLWHHHDRLFCLTAHPELCLEWKEKAGPKFIKWIVKKKPPMELVRFDDPEHYVYLTDPHLRALRDQPKDTLFLGRGIQQTAMDLTARMGSPRGVMVGIDMAKLGEDHHGHNQHVRYHGLKETDVFDEYRRWTRAARRVLRTYHLVRFYSFSPLLGSDDLNTDYLALRDDFGLDKLPEPEDTSGYKRPRTDTPQ